jgi:hypothetical protein
MLHPIEIKANIEGGVGQALAALGDPVPATKRQIWFAEDRGGLQAGGQLKMLSHGIILRIRIGEGPDDSTAKLRPVDKEQLTKQWSKPFQEPFKYRIEGDWSGDRHALAASAQTSHPQGSLAESVGAGRFDQVFTPEQRQFVRDCAHIGVDINQLVGLGPIASTQWEDLQIGGVDDVNAERWTVADLDFLESFPSASRRRRTSRPRSTGCAPSAPRKTCWPLSPISDCNCPATLKIRRSGFLPHW